MRLTNSENKFKSVSLKLENIQEKIFGMLFFQFMYHKFSNYVPGKLKGSTFCIKIFSLRYLKKKQH